MIRKSGSRFYEKIMLHQKHDPEKALGALATGRKHDFDAPVLLPPALIVFAIARHVRRDRLGLAIAFGRRRSRHHIVGSEPVVHRSGAGFREPHVVGVVADRVGMPFDPGTAAASVSSASGRKLALSKSNNA